MLQLEAGPHWAGLRLDKYLAESAPDLSRSRVQQLIEDGKVEVDGKAAKASQKLRGGERITVVVPPPEPTGVAPEDIPLDIRYEDADLVVINKPQGMATHPAPGTRRGTLVNALLARISDLSGIGGELRPGIVHRLDKDTSGLLVVAKHDRAHRALQAQIQAKSASREYLAVARGRLKVHEGTVDAPIGRHPKDRVRMAVLPDGRPAVTHFCVIEEMRDATLVHLKLQTGRTHQIRVHLAHLGHPIVGDPVYGTASPIKVPGQLLHAWRLSFDHPATGRRLTFEAAPPADFERALKFFRQRT
jgi:23S rRNA pseudouridine1911/1915/1917 synthase